jgi:SAM-dependent methyltransferase
MAAPITWLSNERFTVGETVFQTPPPGMLLTPDPMEGVDFFVMKDRALIERHASLIAELRPQRIVELGVFTGGSTALLAELAAPTTLVAVDNRPVEPALQAFLARRGLEHAVRVHDDVDQADRARLAEIVGGEPLDLVVDDCSHLYAPTRASFNELFPRLRPGGQFVIEDWRWAHPHLDADDDGLFEGETPLTRLIFEIVLAVPSVPGLIDEVVIDEESVRIARGDAPIDPPGFDIAACCRPRGRQLLADARKFGD